MTFLCFALAMSVTKAVSAETQTVIPLHKSGGGSGGDEPAVLIQAQDRDFYGIAPLWGGKGSSVDNLPAPGGGSGQRMRNDFRIEHDWDRNYAERFFLWNSR
jgi:hypothetical protein